MKFDRQQIRLEQFSIEARYHSAYNYLSLKGVLAERWAHGPVFGALVDSGQHVALTPGPSSDRRVQGIYGLKLAAFREGHVSQPQHTKELALQWLTDVYEVLRPQRTVQLTSQWFGLHPLYGLKNASQASEYLREEFGQLTSLSVFNASGYDTWLSAVDGMLIKGKQHLSYIVGAVGPPHQGRFFAWDDQQRDSEWWMGVHVQLHHGNDEGIDQPLDVLYSVVDESERYYDNVIDRAFPKIVR